MDGIVKTNKQTNFSGFQQQRFASYWCYLPITGQLTLLHVISLQEPD